jgi:exosortase A-associated hydrolase 1
VIAFTCGEDALFGTLDEAAGTTGLLLVSGGNEIRSGAYAGQAALAQTVAQAGYPVFRFDRRGIGDSAGENTGFDGSADDVAAALNAFYTHATHIKRVVAFGNCDAASALALFHEGTAIDALLLANPWAIDAAAQNVDDNPAPPSAAAIRSRYWARLKNPRSLVDLFTGKINLRKLAGGLASASRKQSVSSLAVRMAQALERTQLPVSIFIARRDTTALAFMAAWADDAFKPVRAKANITVEQINSASHSFADKAAKDWLIEHILSALRA